MKINAGAELLETQDLGDLVSHLRDFDQSSGAEPPVQVVVKCPFLAMRYPKNHTSVRRVQIKFKNESDYHVALNVLKDLGLPISDNVPPRVVLRHSQRFDQQTVFSYAEPWFIVRASATVSSCPRVHKRSPIPQPVHSSFVNSIQRNASTGICCDETSFNIRSWPNAVSLFSSNV
ncbi:hypothetical protein M7I_5208 [Glarea lozoyensis 74030]|uniref:Uncharacterized protein n=1 Tax=Glarea lozoyensis (strain ATCC 74030 / MF5533) TaxID=1104152 RepID=H0ER90_GLAL7|nr:hypothetical protein M7I_5208 [Glarea lozoyensis 74030]